MNKIYVLEFNLFHSRFLRIHMSQKSFQEWRKISSLHKTRMYADICLSAIYIYIQFVLGRGTSQPDRKKYMPRWK